MRIIRVQEEESGGATALWVVAGALLGVAGGILLAERLSGRRRGLRGLWDRASALAGRAAERWEPLLDAAIAARDAWNADDDERSEERGEIEEELRDEDEEDFEGEEEDFEDLEDEHEEEEEEEGEEEGEEAAEEEEEEGVPRLDERVLEAFSNDPVLAERPIEIEQTDEGGVLLHGEVRTSREVAHAVTLARGVPGVAGVRQRLRVRDRR